jgi:hypothetical protein
LGRPYPVQIIKNFKPLGFGANHNQAFKYCQSKYFAVLNPDIRLNEFDIQSMLDVMKDSSVGVAAPKVISPNDMLEDSVRLFPTFSRFFRRTVLKQRQPDYVWGETAFKVDWAAGMFMLFRSSAYAAVKGFDEKRFFMYLEDADICKRLWRNGWSVVATPNATVIHHAQRASRKNFKHMKWHVTSAFRFLTGL